MPRHARLDAPSSLHHGIARCLNREFLIHGSEAHAELLRRMPLSLGTVDARPLAFAIMSNHLHLALLTGADALSRFFQSLLGGTARWINRTLGRLGPVFVGRYGDIVCPEERTAVLLAYIHNNPVRARVVADPADSDWTSHRAIIGDTPAPPWLDVGRALAASGFDSSPAGRSNFHSFVLSRASLGRDPLLSGDSPQVARREARRLVGAACGVTDASLAPVLDKGERQLFVTPGAAVRPRWPGDVASVLLAVSERMGVDVADVQQRDRRRAVVQVRRTALWLWRFRLGRPQVEMSAAVGLSEPAASHLLRERGKVDLVLVNELANRLWGDAGGGPGSDGRGPLLR